MKHTGMLAWILKLCVAYTMPEGWIYLSSIPKPVRRCSLQPQGTVSNERFCPSMNTAGALDASLPLPAALLSVYFSCLSVSLETTKGKKVSSFSLLRVRTSHFRCARGRSFHGVNELVINTQVCSLRSPSSHRVI